jgi:hypothetical protein
MLKNKKQLFKLLSYSSSVLLILGLAGSVYGVFRTPKYEDKLENTLLESKDSEGFIEYYHLKEKQLYDLYKSGDISAKEYNTRLDALKTIEGLMGNKHEFMAENEAKNIDNLNRKAKTSRVIGNVSLITSLASWGLLTLATDKKHLIDTEEFHKSRTSNEFSSEI